MTTKYWKRLGYEPGDPAVLKAHLARRQQLCRRYGADFKNDYGWAAKALKKPNPTIRELEEAVKLDHLRPYYRLASHGSHANPKGVTFQLEKPLPDSTLIVDASNAGLADPGQSALISLGQCTANLLTYKPTIDTVLSAGVIQRFIDEACRAFIEVHERMVQEERLIRSGAEAASDQL